MGKEMKISMPLYKIVYSICFVLGLSLVRGTAYTNEIGIALEAPMAILAAVFLSDTYVQEIAGKRWEVYRLSPLRKRVFSILERIVIQEGYLFVLSIIGYACFIFIQHPARSNIVQGVGSEKYLFWIYAAAIVVTISFWGILSNLISSLFGGMWAGVGGSLLLWILTNSQAGDRVLGNYNIFSYTFRNLDKSGNCADLSWLCGKAVCIVLMVLMLALLPFILKRCSAVHMFYAGGRKD